MTDDKLNPRELCAYDAGFRDALATYAYSSSAAWAVSGVQYVGTGATTLASAVHDRRAAFNYRPSLKCNP